MCGIVGWVEFGGNRVDGATLERARDRLASRGPDDKGLWIERKEIAGLAHRRLSILDTSKAGHQPMVSSDGRYAVVYNGEIYNHREIRDRLSGRGYSFRTGCDTEVIPAAYDAWGPSCVEQFNGMFAIAMWDRIDRRLFVARDRLGIKPLYLHATGDRVLFASRPLALLELPDCPREVDPEALGLYFELGFVPAPWSILAGVRKVEPGCWMRIGRGRIEENRYWSIDGIHPCPDLAGDDALTDRLEELLGDAVRRRLVADVPLGAFLSGGIDSSTVVAMMRRHGTSTPRTFSIGFDNDRYDEAPYAHRVAELLGAEHHRRTFRPADVLTLLDRYAREYDEPFADYSGLPTMLLSAFTREHVTVALSGDGGDELFAGYDIYGYLQRLRPWFRVPRWARAIAGAALTTTRRHRPVLLGHVVAEKDLLDAFAFLRTILRDHPLESLTTVTGQRARDLFRGRAEIQPETDPVAVAQRLDAAYYLADCILQKVDVASMATGLEARVPLLDHRVVEFALSLPPRFRIRNGERKWLLRRVLDRHLPHEMFDRPKCGFGVPLREWFRGELRPALEKELDADRIAAIGLIDPDGVRRLVDLHLSGRRDTHAELWAVLAFVRWHEAVLQ